MGFLSNAYYLSVVDSSHFKRFSEYIIYQIKKYYELLMEN